MLAAKKKTVKEKTPFIPDRAEDINDIIEKELYSEYGVIWFDQDIDNDSVRWLIQKIMYYAVKDPSQPIIINLNTDGGDVYEFLRMYDCVHSVKNPVNIMVEGKAFSAGALITACCDTGERTALKHSTFMIHQLSSWTVGKLNDLEDDFKEAKRLQELIISLLAKHTKMSADVARVLCERDTFFTAEQALEYGVIDRII